MLLPAYDNGLPLVFDDAFSQSDPERLLGLTRMLRRGMQQGVQLVLLSCTPASFQSELVEAEAAAPKAAAKTNPPANGEGIDKEPPDVVSVTLG